MLERNDGHLVTVSSVAGVVGDYSQLVFYFIQLTICCYCLLGTSHLSDYSASKFGAVGLIESLAVELENLKKTGVKTTLICPYYIDTGMFAGIQTRYRWLMLN